jgi:hypothetical protein
MALYDDFSLIRRISKKIRFGFIHCMTDSDFYSMQFYVENKYKYNIFCQLKFDFPNIFALNQKNFYKYDLMINAGKSQCIYKVLCLGQVLFSKDISNIKNEFKKIEFFTYCTKLYKINPYLLTNGV